MSLWYAAHILMCVKRKSGSSARIPLWENIVLIKADSEAEAFAKAEQRGKQDEGDDGGTFRWNGQPATWVFAGVRKLTLCDDAAKRPGDGSEISYSEMEVTEQTLADLLKGKPALVKLTDDTASSEQNGKGFAVKQPA